NPSHPPSHGPCGSPGRRLCSAPALEDRRAGGQLTGRGGSRSALAPQGPSRPEATWCNAL
ncbi:hypothetical protein NDU88_002249, partial [Pleurodeles waltl]